LSSTFLSRAKRLFDHDSYTRLSLLLVLAICVAAQPWHRQTGVLAFQVAILFSCILSFKGANLTKHLYQYRWLAVSLALVAMVSLFSWVFRTYEMAPLRSVKPYVTLLAMIPLSIAMKATGFRRWQVALITIVAGLSLGVYALKELYDGTHGRWDAVENAVEFGNYAALVAGMLLVISTQLQTVKFKWPLIVLSLLGAVAAFYVTYKSGTRSSLGIVVLAALCVFAYLLFSMKNWIALALLAVCILGASMTIKETARYGDLENELSKAYVGGYSSGSLGQRLELWRLSGCIADEYPALGVGTGSFKHAQLDHWPATCGVEIRAPKGYFSQAHSVYFQSLATMGYLGLTALMLVLLILLCVAIRSVPSGGLVLLFIVSSFMVAGLTVDLFFKDFMVARFVLLTSLGLACLQNDDTGGLKGVP